MNPSRAVVDDSTDLMIRNAALLEGRAKIRSVLLRHRDQQAARCLGIREQVHEEWIDRFVHCYSVFAELSVGAMFSRRIRITSGGVLFRGSRVIRSTT
jgi:hypothetical protein